MAGFNIADLFALPALNRLLQPAQSAQGVPNMLTALPSQNVSAPPAIAAVDPWQGLREQDVSAPQYAQPQPQNLGPAQQPSSGIADFFNGDRRADLNSFFTGLAQGQDPNQSFGLAAANLSQSRAGRGQVNQTVDWLKSKGMDDGQARQLAASPPALNEYLKTLVKGSEATKPIEVNGQLVDPNTYKVIGDYRTPQAATGEKDTALIRELVAAGLKPGTPEFQEAILANNRPKGMMIESDGQGGFKMVQGTDVSGGANMNVEQGKNTGFLLRAQDADKTISSLEKEGTSVFNNTVGQLPLVGNFARSDDAQKFDQAKRDFINAQLRQESGAVISPEEFKNAEIQYFPQPGDSQAVIEQKRANRQNAISGFRIRSGPGAQSVDKMNKAPPQVIDGYTIEEIQ